MARSRRKLSKELKAKVVLEALRGNRSLNEIASRYEVHPNQIQTWKKQALEGLPGLFADRRTSDGKSEEALLSRLYEQIGKLQMELEWLKKKGEA